MLLSEKFKQYCLAENIDYQTNFLPKWYALLQICVGIKCLSSYPTYDYRRLVNFYGNHWNDPEYSFNYLKCNIGEVVNTLGHTNFDGFKYPNLADLTLRGIAPNMSLYSNSGNDFYKDFIIKDKDINIYPPVRDIARALLISSERYNFSNSLEFFIGVFDNSWHLHMNLKKWREHLGIKYSATDPINKEIIKRIPCNWGYFLGSLAHKVGTPRLFKYCYITYNKHHFNLSRERQQQLVQNVESVMEKLLRDDIYRTISDTQRYMYEIK